MKTFRQQLRNWVKEKKELGRTPEEMFLLEEVMNKINELEKVEIDTINRAYHKGHMDGENNKNPMANYYKNTHKVNSLFRTMLKK